MPNTLVAITRMGGYFSVSVKGDSKARERLRCYLWLFLQYYWRFLGLRHKRGGALNSRMPDYVVGMPTR